MSALDAYLEFARSHSELFQNPGEDGIQILLDPQAIRHVESIAADSLRAQGLPTQWAEVGIVFQDAFGIILRDAVSFPGGSVGTHGRFIGARRGIPGAAVLPIYHDKILLLRHFRHATRSWHLEVPRGFGAVGLAPVDVARIELMEEMGAKVVGLVALGTVHPDSGASPWCVALFAGEVEEYGSVEYEAGISQVVEVGLPEFEHLIRESEITDGFTISIFARARLHGIL